MAKGRRGGRGRSRDNRENCEGCYWDKPFHTSDHCRTCKRDKEDNYCKFS